MPGDIVKLALAFLKAEEAELAIRLRVLKCHRASDYVLASALESAHRKAVEKRDRAEEKLRALRLELGDVSAPD